MALVDSLLTAMVRADGDALVMHVGERPIVVAGSKTIDLSTHGMNLGAMVGMLGQLLSGDALASLKEFGAVEHALPSRDNDHFSVVAARSGDDIWIEIRRRREAPKPADVPAPVEAAAVPEPAPVAAEPEPVPAPVEAAAPVVEPEPVPAVATDDVPAAEVVPVVEEEPLPPVAAEAAHVVGTEPEAVVEPEAELVRPEPLPVVEMDAVPVSETESALVTEVEVVTMVEVTADVEVEPAPVSEPVAAAPEVEPAGVVSEPAMPELEPVAVAASEPEPEPETAPEPSPAPAIEIAEIAAANEPEPEPAVATVTSDAEAEPLVESVAIEPEPERAIAVSHEREPESEPEPVEVATALPSEPEAETVSEETAPVEVIAAAASADATLDTPAHADVPAIAAMASASSSTYPASTFAPVVPMEPERLAGPTAGGPPSRPFAPHATAGVAGGPSQLEPHLTRTVRIEVPERNAGSRSTGLDRLLRAADAMGASELFVVSQTRPYVRVGGNVRPLAEESPLVPTDIDTLISDVTPEPWRDAVRRGDPAEWLIELPDIGRVRCSTFRDLRGPGANFHFAFLRAATADELQLSAEARRLATEPDGLILVSGGAASDMSAIVAAFVDILNHQRADYIVTLEPQVRVLHVNREALVSQREVGLDPVRVATAARAALREEPDVLVIEGITTGEVARLAIEAAAQDRLVIASIDAPSAPAAVQRLIGLVSDDQRQAARATLSQCFRGAVAQLLLRKVTGGRIAARELLAGTRAVARILADGDLSHLDEAAETPGAGHVTMADTIVEYVRSGVVDLREAVRKAPDAEDLVARLKEAGVDAGHLR